jgi:hypothetical protein
MAEMLTETCGLVVPPGDVSRLVASLRDALSVSGEERRQMKAAARQTVRDRFDHGVIIPRLLGVYQEAVAAHSARCGSN